MARLSAGFRLVRPAAPRMLRTVPNRAVTATRKTVVSAPVAISLTASCSQLKSRLLSIGLQIFRVERAVQPFDRDGIQGSIREHLRDDIVDRLFKARLILVEADVIR